MALFNLGEDNFLKRLSIGAPLLILVMLATIILPIPPLMLDILFTFNISLSLIILLSALYVDKPINFDIFPTILLAATLLRLTLNIASTRVVLLNGHNGPGSAGDVIHAFGEVVIGGNFAIGIIIFVILVIINFVVITKGAGRISEVSARFTLDSMPGKQMAIDADLNAGVINQEEAKARRQEVVQEADFYGSMDGASKFVKGDAIAGILVLFINLVGGIAIGIFQHGMSAFMATHVFALLTIGDGLVAQIPSLLLSTAAAIMVTRVSSDHDISTQTFTQLLKNPKPLWVTATVIGGLAIIPGMPHMVFAILAVILAAGGYFAQLANQKQQAEAQAGEQPEQTQKDHELSWDDIKPIDVIGLEVGYRLIKLIGVGEEAELMARIKGIRRKLSQEFGFLVPNIHIKDNLELEADAYQITLMGVQTSSGVVQLDKLLAINPGHITTVLPGIQVKEPTFGMDATWIDTEKKDYAKSLGYTVVDPATVIATHISHIVRENIHRLFGHEEAQQLITGLQSSAPKLVDNLNANEQLPLGVIVQILKKLLQSRIPLIDMRTIVEKLIEGARTTQDPDLLTESVRVGLNRLIVQNISGNLIELPVITFSPQLEQILHQNIRVATEHQQGSMGIEPGLTEKILTQLLEYTQTCVTAGQPAILLVSQALRQVLEHIFKPSLQMLHILSHQEIPDDKKLKIVSVIGDNSQ